MFALIHVQYKGATHDPGYDVINFRLRRRVLPRSYPSPAVVHVAEATRRKAASQEEILQKAWLLEGCEKKFHKKPGFLNEKKFHKKPGFLNGLLEWAS